MSISAKVKAMMALSGIKQTDLAKTFGTSVQAINNKIRLERWSAADLCIVAKECGAELAFVIPDGQKFTLSVNDKNPGEAPG